LTQNDNNGGNDDNTTVKTIILLLENIAKIDHQKGERYGPLINRHHRRKRNMIVCANNFALKTFLDLSPVLMGEEQTEQDGKHPSRSDRSGVAAFLV